MQIAQHSAQLTSKHLQKRPTNGLTSKHIEYTRTYTHNINNNTINCIFTTPNNNSDDECRRILPSGISRAHP